MKDEISSLSEARRGDPREQAVFQLWQQQLQQISAARLAAEAVAATEVPRAPAGPWIGTDAAGLSAGPSPLDLRPPVVDLEAVHVPDDLMGVGALPPAGRALTELGVVASLSRVAEAFTRPTFSPGELAGALSRLAANMTGVSDQLEGVPGVVAALEAFGGVGDIVTGLRGLSQTLQEVKADGPSLSRGLGAAAGAARLVAGVAMALSPLCPPLGGVGEAIALAGIALELGKLGWDQRGGAASPGGKLTRGGQAEQEGPTPIIGNNGANMVRVDLKQPWTWLTG